MAVLPNPWWFTMPGYHQPDEAAENGLNPKPKFREKASNELREFFVLTAYLYICFAAVIFFKTAVLQAHGISYDHFRLAILKAALCAKFILVGRIFHLGDRFSKLPLVVPTLYKSFVFLLLLSALTFIEEILVGAIHGRTVMEAVSDVAGGVRRQII
jgi:hypothetical protein